MSNEPNDIDLLMSRDPTEMTDADIDAIIAYNRNQRERETGTTRKARKAADGPALDLTKLGLKVAGPKINRRI